MTIGELIKDWMVNHEQERIRAQTYSRYRGLIDLHIFPAFGETEIHELIRRRMHDFLTEKKREGNKCTGGSLSATSVNLMLSILNMAFEYAYDLEMDTVNPCDRLKRTPSTDSKKLEAFTRAEQRKIEQTINAEDDDRLFGIVLCLYSGLRIGELMALEWTDLNDDCTILTVSKTVYRDKGSIGVWRLCVDDPKTKSSNQKIPLPPHISERLLNSEQNQKANITSQIKITSECQHARINIYSKNSQKGQKCGSSTSMPCGTPSQLCIGVRNGHQNSVRNHGA